MFQRFINVLSEPRKLVGIGAVVMVSCLLLLAAFYYDLGSTGGTFAALGFALFLIALFAPIPRWLKASLETVAAAGLIRGGIMLGLAPGDTLFLSGALAFAMWLDWVGHDPPSEDDTKRRNSETPEQKQTDQQAGAHYLRVDN